MSKITMFQYLDFETIGNCNRRCVTCIRNSHPDKTKTASWFSGDLLSMDVIKAALDECRNGGFTGGVCLSHYNEPLMDDRIADIAKLVKSYNQFSSIFLNTNGDFLSEELAKSLDGVLDHIIVSLYMDEPASVKRAAWITSLFKQTRPVIDVMGKHIATHFSPSFDVKALSEEYRGYPCHEPKTRVVINHRRQFLLCCDDVIGNFDLGRFPDITIGEYWLGKKHRRLVEDLERPGGRYLYDYCKVCPKT